MRGGIAAYGAYIPRLRVTSREYVKAWGACAAPIKEKAVPDFDEDVITMGLEAAKYALGLSTQSAAKAVRVLSIATTSPPYAEKVLGSTFAAALDLDSGVFTTEHTTSTKAGAEALVTALALLEDIPDASGLVVASDAPVAEVGDSIEHGLGAGAVAFLVGHEGVVAELEGYTSVIAESMGERFRRTGDVGIRDIGVREFTTSTFFAVSTEAIKRLMRTTGQNPSAYRFVVLPQHDARAAQNLGLRLGFTETQIKPGFLYERVGDVGACSSLLGLAAVLDLAEPGDRILVLAYGSGAGVVALDFVVREGIADRRPRRSVESMLAEREHIDYVSYLKRRRAL